MLVLATIQNLYYVYQIDESSRTRIFSNPDEVAKVFKASYIMILIIMEDGQVCKIL